MARHARHMCPPTSPAELMTVRTFVGTPARSAAATSHLMRRKDRR
jgi:hypothetical protein